MWRSTIYSDASNTGLKCALLHMVNWGHTHLVTYSKRCKIYTDHKSLKQIFIQKELNSHQRRWIKSLKDYGMTINYHQRKAYAVADALDTKS